MTQNDDIRAFIGLSADEPLVPALFDPAPAATTTHAFQQDLSALRARPIFERVERREDTGIYRHQRAPAVVLIEVAPERVVARSGAVEDWEDGVVLDGRAGRAMVRWRVEDSEHALVNERGDLSLFELGSPPLARLRPEAPAAATLTVPAPAALLGTAAAAPWLLERVEALASCSSPCLSAASVGTLARLGAPVDPDGVGSLVRRARAWALSLSETDREQICRDALLQVGVCHERLERLSEQVFEGLDASAVLLEVIDLRDLLASAAWVTRSSTDPLGSALAAFDEEVETRWSELPRVPEEIAELCREVGWREPWAWWGRLEEA